MRSAMSIWAKLEKLAKKMHSGKGFDLNDFKMQIVQMRKMGGMSPH